MKNIRFGILGPGKIANRFAEAFQHAPGAIVHGVASRDAGKAAQFAKQHNVARVYDSYEQMVNDPEIDIVYVATPHTFHKEHSLLCLRHRKAVLCEKPLALNARECREMVAEARKQRVFFMEGMWSAFFPAIQKVRQLIRDGVIGDVTYVNADFGFSGPVSPTSRLYDTALGGGAQLDVGIYPLFLATFLLGKPTAISAHGKLAATGADETTMALLSYPNGKTANILSSIVTDTPKEAVIGGTLGRIHIHAPWYKTQELTLRLHNGETKAMPFPHSGNGFEFQIREVVACLNAGLTEHADMTHDFSLMMADISDEIRRQCGIRYEADR